MVDTEEIEFTIKETESNSKIRINSDVDNLDIEYIKDHVIIIIQKHISIFENSTIDLFIRKHRFQSKTIPSHYARIFIFTEREDFDITSDHMDWRKAFIDALFRLERKVLKKKILIKNWSSKRYPYSFSDNHAFKRPKENIILSENRASRKIPVK